MTCKLCQERPVPANYGSPRRCAFGKDGTFEPDNWNCETMNELRLLPDYRDRCDESAGSINVFRVEESDISQTGYIVLTFHKDRGLVGGALVVNDNEPPQSLAMATAEHVLRCLWKRNGIVW